MIFTSPYFLFHILQRSPHFSEVGIVILGFPVIAKWFILGLTVIGWFCMLKPQEWFEEVQYLELIMHFPKQNVKLRRCSASW
jgi:hypothetical protein